ncbi:MAG: hypothetical protein BGO12_05170 [Verrucomicrobia bacterium 61-8]|nr:hypothetical protein [Verrucomicrobiota bacterium]OJU97736.1 MAG: hypothetical protein BGO12_05170 [Verrucomicrobia bacterium 61-8]
MRHIAESPLFTRWRDPVSGVEILILSRRAAPLQQSFYFTQSGFSDDGGHIWYIDYHHGMAKVHLAVGEQMRV